MFMHSGWMGVCRHSELAEDLRSGDSFESRPQELFFTCERLLQQISGVLWHAGIDLVFFLPQ